MPTSLQTILRVQLLTWLLALSALADESRTLSILYTGGLDGRLRTWQQDETDTGGMARVVGLLRQAGPDSLILDTGDTFGPALLSRWDGGRTMVRLMTRAGYAAMLPGNHDLSLHIDTLRARAAEARFTIIASNLVSDDGDSAVFTPAIIVRRAGLRIALIGLLTPDLFEQVHPADREGVSLSRPSSAISQALDSLDDADIDLTVALAHMQYDEVLELAQQADDVDLFIVGGYGGSKGPDEFLQAVQLGSGTRIVSMPGTGFVGHVDLTFVERDGGWEPAAMESRFEALRHPVADDTAAHWVAEQVALFQRQRASIVGTLRDPPADATRYVANLMRTSANAEVAVINQGTLRSLALPAQVRQSALDSLVRFDDDVVVVDLRGSELKRMYSDSRKRERAGQQLVFVGYDTDEGTVNGRELESGERFRVATTSFLARGGDGYLRSAEFRPLPRHPRLRSLLLEAVQAGGALPGVDARRGRSVWITQWEPKGTLSLTNTYEQDEDEPFENALAWNGVLQTTSTHATPGRSLVHDFRTRFGQVRGRDGLEESTDKIDSKLTMTWLRQGLEPFASLDLNTEWSARPGRDRRLTVRGTSGLETELGNGDISVGLGVERDYADDETQVGIELVPEYDFEFLGLELETQTEVFYAALKQRFTTQNQSELGIDLPGDLKFSIDFELDFEWDADDGRQLQTELQMGLGLGFEWDGKLAR